MADIFEKRAKTPLPADQFEARKKKPSFGKFQRTLARAPAQFFAEAVGQVPQIVELAAATQEPIEILEEEERPSFLSGAGLEPAPERGLRNLLALLGRTETAQQLTPQKLIERFHETTGGQFAPQSAIERIIDRGVQLAGGAVGVGAPLKAALPFGISGLGGQSLREVQAPEWLASATEILGPLARVPIKGFVPSSAEEELIEFGRARGLTDEQLAPLLKTPETQARLGSLGLKTPKLRKSVQEMSQKFSENFFEPLLEKAESLPPFGEEQVDNFLENIEKVRERLNKSKLPTPDKEEAIKSIDKMVKRINIEGLTPAVVIESWRDINKNVNWKRTGSKPLQKVKEAFEEILKLAHPELYKEFETTNKLYSRFKPFEKALSPDRIDQFLNLGEGGELALAMAFHNPGLLKTALGAVGGKYVANKLLTSPRFANLAAKFRKAVAQGKTAAIHKLNEKLHTLVEKEK